MHLEVVFAVWEAPFIILLAWKLFAVPHAVSYSAFYCTSQNQTKYAFAVPTSLDFLFGYWLGT